VLYIITLIQRRYVLNKSLYFFFLTVLISCVSLEDIHTATPNLSQIPDGVYEGNFTRAPVTAEVKVTMASGRITLVELLKHTTLLGKNAEVLIDQIVQQQSLDLDAVSGATHSSKVILKAVETALDSRGRNN